MNSGDPLSLERQICFALTVASRSIVAAYKPVLEPLGITHPQYLVMLALWEAQPAVAVTELAKTLHQDASTLSPLLKRLEAQGLLTRRRSGADERRLEVSLTREGKQLRAKAEAVPGAMAERLGMSPERLTALHSSMLELIEASRTSLADEPGRDERASEARPGADS